MARVAPLLLTVASLMGCGSPHEDSGTSEGIVLRKAVAADYARALAALAPGISVTNADQGGTQAIADEDARKIADKVLGDLKQGKQEPIAQVVLHRKRWSETMWYSYAETAFAMAWKARSVPLRIGASSNTVAALTAVAREGQGRTARMAAAISLANDMPELAKDVLLAEYGNFEIDSWDMVAAYRWPFACPMGTGEHLRGLGVMVPDEVTSVAGADEMYRVIFAEAPVKSTHRELLAEAGNLFNAKLRDMLAKRQRDKLAHYFALPARLALFRVCWKEAPASLKRKPKLPGKVFVTEPEDSDGSSIFDTD